jgi:hypothetical protein
LNQLLLPISLDPADEYQPQTQHTHSQLNYQPYQALDLQKLGEIFSTVEVAPNTPENTPAGIRIDFHHRKTVHFRMDYHLNYESRSPLGLDDNPEFGYQPVNFAGDDFLQLRSKNNSIRLTTLAYRFNPSDFPNLNLKLAVTKGVAGADPVLGGAGRDDSAFQLWFTLRQGHGPKNQNPVETKANEVFLFGYYWGDPSPTGETRSPGQIFENWYSKKNIIITRLPESKQLLLNSPEMLGRPVEFKHNLRHDLQRAYPEREVDKMEVMAITIQHDSNDSAGQSEAYFKHLHLLQ